jgi:diazepam-binding inhibitor (GABA receptor modulating acyl-CoA-binding protein)
LTRALREFKEIEASLENEDRIRLLAYSKQAQVGDCSKEYPAALLFEGEEQLLWRAWNKLRGLSREEALKAFVKQVSDAN